MYSGFSSLRSLAAAAQILVEFKAQEALHRLRSEVVLHHHQRGVLRHGLVDRGRAFDVGGDHLVRPPLMPGLVRGDVERQVDGVGLLADLGDEADRLGEGNRVGERFGKGAVAREIR